MRNAALVLSGMLLTLLIQPMRVPTATAQIGRDESQTLSNVSQAPEAATWIFCTPVQIVTYSSRVHVQCQTAVGGISYFVVSTSDASKAARFLSVISTAQVAGRTLSILYDPADTSGTSIGCQSSDCRLMQAVGFGQ
ncbi:MAG: hypothetical protein HZB51_05975 [Chloroflexi bacterium]|nr:hypothetical protein [Chloroflexota bacterium]